MSDSVFLLDKWEGKAIGGIFWRGFDLVEFIKKIEKQKGKVVGIKFDGSYNVEFIFEPKEGEGN